MSTWKNHPDEVSDEALDSDYPLYEDEEEGFEEDYFEEEEEVEEEEVYPEGPADGSDEENIPSPIENLPSVVRNRVKALQVLQQQKNDIREGFLSSIRKLQQKYEGELEVLLDDQRAIIKGSQTDDGQEVEQSFPQAEESSTQGIPDFWLHVLQQNSFIRSRIYPRDEEALSYLVDIRCKASEENPSAGFILYFEFRPNPFFEETILTKQYIKKPCVTDAISEWYLADIVGSTITWKSDEKNLTLEGTEKKQRSKKTREVRHITVYEPCESFFTFFTAPKFPEDVKEPYEEKANVDAPPGEEGEDTEGELEDYIDEDYEMACVIKERILLRALDYFIGEVDSSGAEEEEFEDLPEDDISSDGLITESRRDLGKQRNSGQEECRQQ